MDISRISGSGGSVIWDALMAVSKKTVKPTAVNTASKEIPGALSSPVQAATKSETSKKSDLINRLDNLQASDSGLALLKALNNSVSNTSLADILQTGNSTASATDSTNLDNVLQSIGSNGTSDKITGGTNDLLSSLKMTSNAFMSINALSPDSTDPLTDAASVEKTLNSFMRVPDVSKYIAGRQSLESMISKFNVIV